MLNRKYKSLSFKFYLGMWKYNHYIEFKILKDSQNEKYCFIDECDKKYRITIAKNER